MNEEALDKFVPRLATEQREFIDGERAYKIEWSKAARTNVEEALDGKRAWTEVFVGRARSILTNQLASNQQTNLAMASLLKSDEAALDSVVRSWWVDENLGAASTALDLIVDDESRGDLKQFRGLGSRAAVLSFFRLLKDPENYPIYRPGHISKVLSLLGHPKLGGENADERLQQYDAFLDDTRERFAARGFDLLDRLHVQSALWALKGMEPNNGKSVEPEESGASEDVANNLALSTDLKTISDTAEAVAERVVDLQAWLKTRGFHYLTGLVSHFLAALLTKPFVILSGLSGTGKSRLAIEVGSRMGSVHVVPVKPDWTDTRGVLGYLNPLTGRYETTEALRAILTARSSTRPVTLILDEMNLAHVEHYFADVLSAMESGVPMPLHDSEEVEAKQGIPQALAWPPNLLIVGTVNADETTYPFSPKVLDRAFVIDMSYVDLARYFGTDASKGSATAPTLPPFTPTRDWRTLNRNNEDERFILRLHVAMEAAGWPFGYRTADESLAFLAHAQAFKTTGLRARDALLASKILPRLHGRQHEIEPVLIQLAQFIGTDLEEWEDEQEPEEFATTTRMLRRMYRQLMDEGHLASMLG